MVNAGPVMVVLCLYICTCLLDNIIVHAPTVQCHAVRCFYVQS